MLAYEYFAYVDYPHLVQRVATHSQILDGTALSPYRYRILVPFLAETMINGISLFQPYQRAFLLAYGVYDVVVFSLLMATLYVYLRLWFSRTQSLVGILFAAATMPIALRDHFFQPWSPLETVFFTLGLLLCYRRRYCLMGVTIVVATLNRETAIFLAIAYWLTDLGPGTAARPGGGEWSRRMWAMGSLYLLLWVVVFFGLRWVRGTTGHAISIAELWAANTTPSYLVRALVNSGLFGGAFWAFAILGIRYAPDYVRRSAGVVPLYLVTVVIFGVWYEARLLMPLYPILIPLGLSFLYRHEDPSTIAAVPART